MRNKNDTSASLPNHEAAPPLPGRRRHKTVIKMVALAVLTLLMMIPLGMVSGVLRERLCRRTGVIQELASSWGGEQTLVGPILTVPYRYQHNVRKEQVVGDKLKFVDVIQTDVAYAHFLPKALRVNGSLDPSVLHRGIYDAIVYRGTLQVSGSFDVPVFEQWGVAPGDVQWEDAFVSLSITDLRGAQDALVLQWGGQSLPLIPGTGLPELSSGVRAPLKGAPLPTGATEFKVDLSLNGSEGIRLAPVGEHNDVNLHSTWPDPSFQGAVLPAERRVTSEGFEARWLASYYSRSYPQQWTSLDVSTFNAGAAPVTTSLFGVDLLPAVDPYRYVERAIKYGVLFIVLVFTAFFLFELVSGLRIHPFQYTMVGAALCLFYLALLSLSEFISFGLAYATGAATCTFLIALYCVGALRSGGRAAIVAGELSIIYGILFVILRLQDYALVLGTAGLFAALGIVMLATRNIDWYARDEERA